VLVTGFKCSGREYNPLGGFLPLFGFWTSSKACPKLIWLPECDVKLWNL